ncbi:hypothetical protein FAI41_05295 [Acetobacteraceae bacterium]|nr:hypothetical protein FAI41_05295 [Acetobacteraceae bacterium]
MMKYFSPYKFVLSLSGFLSLCGCSAFHTDQKILIDTNPSGASCKIYEDGVNARPFPTPALVRVDRKDYVNLNCVKKGYQPVGAIAESHLSWTFPFSAGAYLPVATFTSLATMFGTEGSFLPATPPLMASYHFEKVNGADALRLQRTEKWEHLMYRHHRGPWILDFKPLEKGEPDPVLPNVMDIGHLQEIR